MPRAGLYIHYPFCSSKCPYCHFASRPPGPGLEALWRGGLDREADRASGLDFVFDTLYIGGGTPSLMPPGDIEALRDALGRRFRLDLSEWTLEANPAGETPAGVFREWGRAGITRLSVGVQSFDDSVLRTLGRPYDAAAAAAFVRTAREAGFTSLSLDIMLGVPGETDRSLDRTLTEVRTLSPDHVSVYLLENIEGLPFEAIVRAWPVDDDAMADRFERAAACLADIGLNRYEISNFARPGHECRHNLKYWRYEPFLGLGPSAASLLPDRRFVNKDSLEDWAASLRAGEDGRAETMVLDRETAAREALAAGLRLVEGIDLRVFRERFGADIQEDRRNAIAGLAGDGFLDLTAGRLRIPAGKLLVSNAILARLV